MKQKKAAVTKATAEADALIMAAAVADYRPAQISKRKIKKDQGGIAAIELEETSDILNEVAKRKKTPRVGPLVTIGFAAETENLKENAKLKLDKKSLDLIAANDVSREGSGFGADTNQVTLVWKNGQVEELPLMEKAEVSDIIIQETAKLIDSI